MRWLIDFAEATASTDHLSDKSDHRLLLATGLAGEAGSIASEIKKERRDAHIITSSRQKLVEEIGDYLWYFVRLTAVLSARLPQHIGKMAGKDTRSPISTVLDLVKATGDLVTLLSADSSDAHRAQFEQALELVWNRLCDLSEAVDVQLIDAAASNTRKIESRWPKHTQYVELFDSDRTEDQQLPRQLCVEFREVLCEALPTVVLRCNGVNWGDRISDNIQASDGYRFHDVFHLAYAVHLGWSPITRSIFRCKRKSNSRIDEGEDGARAGVIEEAISVIVFNRAKTLSFFDGISRIDYDLLKTIEPLVVGYEVERVPMWQWERAILEGYGVFRQLLRNRGGFVTIDVEKRQLSFAASTTHASGARVATSV